MVDAANTPQARPAAATLDSHGADDATGHPDPDDGNPRSLAALRQRFGDNHRWWVLFTVMIGNMAALMAATTINVAVPAISRQFTLGQHDAQWLATSFMGAMTISMLATPWLLERFGYRQCYLALVALLGVGGAAGGLSNHFGLVLAMRMAEGLAAGVLQTLPGVIIMRAFARHEQGRAMGIFGFGTVLAPAIGPSVGGVLVDLFGWRAIFFFVIPFCIAGAALARRVLPHSAPGGAPVNRHAQPPELPSLLLLAATLAVLLNGLVLLQGAQRWLGVALVATAGALMAMFVLRQRRVAAPLLNLSLFGVPAFNAASVVAVVYGAGLFGSTYLLPVFMVVALKMTPSSVGAVLMPAGLALALTIPVAGRLSDHQPLARTVVIGLSVMCTSFAVMLLVGTGSSVIWITAFAVLGRVGLGLVIPSLNLASVRALPLPLMPYGTSTMNFLRQLGGAIGVSLVGIVLEWRLQAGGGAPGATLRAFHEVFALMALLTGAAAPAARRMRQPAG
jgi:EmrB/QacA subfamily drug resistance transporter